MSAEFSLCCMMTRFIVKHENELYEHSAEEQVSKLQCEYVSA